MALYLDNFLNFYLYYIDTVSEVKQVQKFDFLLLKKGYMKQVQHTGTSANRRDNGSCLLLTVVQEIVD